MFLAPYLNRAAFQEYLPTVRLFQAKDQPSERAFPPAAFADEPYGRAFGQCEVHVSEVGAVFSSKSLPIPDSFWETIADLKQRRFPMCYRHRITLSKALDNVALVSTR